MIPHILTAVQERLKQHYGPHHYYTTNYSVEETTYWTYIPMWMEEIIGKLDKSANILDIGPGYGTLACVASRLSSALVVTTDRHVLISPAVAKEFGLSCVQQDIERTNWSKSLLYDAIILTETLEHFNFDPHPTLQMIHNQCRPGARLFLSTPDSDSWGRIPHNPLPVFDPAIHDNDNPPWFDGHVHHYSAGELMELLQSTGFQIERWYRSTSRGGVHHNLLAKAG